MTPKEPARPGSRAMLNKKDGWYTYCRPYLEQLDPRDDLDLVTYVSGMVCRAKEFKADTLVMMADDGGYPLYPSELAPINTHVHGQDLLAMIEQECRAQGLRFGLGFLGVHCNRHVATTHPEWGMLDKNGKKFSFYTSFLICMNSPYRQYYVNLIREGLARYAVDYVYVEGLYFHSVTPDSDRGCYCRWCRERFKRTRGQELTDACLADRVDFYVDSIVSFQAAIHQAVQEISPETVLVGTSYDDFFGMGNLPALAAHADIVAKENQWGFGRHSLHPLGLGMLTMKTSVQKPILGTWWCSWNVDSNYHQVSAPQAKLTFMQTLAYGAAVQPHIQSLFEVEPSSMPTLAELFSCVERVRDYMLGADLLPYIAVVNSPQCRGYCNALLERHLPFDLIRAEDLRRQRLSAYRAVIVGDGNGIDDQGIAALADYVRDGVGLMCCAGLQENLAELAGVDPQGEEARFDAYQGLPRYYRFDGDGPISRGLRGRLLATWSMTRVTVAADCRVEAQITDLDYGRLHEDHMGLKSYPGEPLGPMVVTRQVGAGRVIYLAADLALAAGCSEKPDPNSVPHNADVPVVLANAADWAAGGRPPITTNAPPSVELVTYVKPGRMLVFVLNNTTSHGTGAIRYVVPLSDIEVRVRVTAPVRAAAAVTGQSAPYQVSDQWLTMRIPRLSEYEVLMIDLADGESRG